jgi:hypothetical protein
MLRNIEKDTLPSFFCEPEQCGLSYSRGVCALCQGQVASIDLLLAHAKGSGVFF